MKKPHKPVIAKENNPSNIKPLLTYEQSKELLRLLEQKGLSVIDLEKVYYSLIELNFIPKGFY